MIKILSVIVSSISSLKTAVDRRRRMSNLTDNIKHAEWTGSVGDQPRVNTVSMKLV